MLCKINQFRNRYQTKKRSIMCCSYLRINWLHGMFAKKNVFHGALYKDIHWQIERKKRNKHNYTRATNMSFHNFFFFLLLSHPGNQCCEKTECYEWRSSVPDHNRLLWENCCHKPNQFSILVQLQPLTDLKRTPKHVLLTSRPNHNAWSTPVNFSAGFCGVVALWASKG